MNKAELIDSIADKGGISKADAKKALDAFIETTGQEMKKRRAYLSCRIRIFFCF